MRKSRDSGEQLQETAHVERCVEESLCITLSTFGHDGVGKAGGGEQERESSTMRIGNHVKQFSFLWW